MQDWQINILKEIEAGMREGTVLKSMAVGRRCGKSPIFQRLLYQQYLEEQSARRLRQARVRRAVLSVIGIEHLCRADYLKQRGGANFKKVKRGNHL